MATAFTFGTFGDFVSIVELVVRGLKSLNASTGSSYDYQCLIQELLALRRILQVLAAATLTGIEVTTVDGLIAEVEYCHVVVERVWEGIRKYEKALGAQSTVVPRGVVARVVGGVRAVEWELFKRKDVGAVRKKLNGHVGRLNTFINICNLSRLNDMPAIASQVKELTVVMRQRPAQVGYGPANGIAFNLFGQRCIFPKNFLGSVEQMKAIAELLSTGWPENMQLEWKEDDRTDPGRDSESLFSSINMEMEIAPLPQGLLFRIVYGSIFRFLNLKGGREKITVNWKIGGKNVLLETVICPDCGGSRSLYPSDEVLLFGGGADWVVSFEEIWNEWMNVGVMRCTFHDPFCNLPYTKEELSLSVFAIPKDSSPRADQR